MNSNNNYSNEEYLTKLFNNYLIFYNSKNKLKNNIFDNINYEDKTSTNNQLEIFYDQYLKYNSIKNNELEIYTSNSTDNKTLKESDELYCLNINNKEFYSTKLFTLLFYITNENLENWKIETLR